MLHLNTIDKTAHQVLLSLLKKEYLKNFALVGGTSLSLRYGHRKSIDLDLFSTIEFDPSQLDVLLKSDYSDYVYRGNNRYMLFAILGLLNQTLSTILLISFRQLKPLKISGCFLSRMLPQ